MPPLNSTVGRHGQVHCVYQIEVKRWLIAHRFPPKGGWNVCVDIDAMERANGGVHSPDKQARAHAAESELRNLGATIGPHPRYGRVDIVAEHPIHGVWLVEVEGRSSRQPEQALYSAIGQLVLNMHGPDGVQFAVALPNSDPWKAQAQKVPKHARSVMSLTIFLVSEEGSVVQ